MRILATLILIFSIGLLPRTVSSLDLSIQRNAFLQAEYALRHNESIQFVILSNSLRGYPLYPYLIYQDLNKRLNQGKVSEQEINNFLQQYSDTPIAGKLRTSWLSYLAQQKNWALFLKYYRPSDDPVLQCQNIQALLSVGKTQEAFQAMPDAWLSDTLQPASCEDVFAIWYQSGKLTPQKIWDRVRLAITKNNPELLKKLIAWSPVDQQKQIQLWQQIVKNPSLVTQSNLFKSIDANTREILIDGFLRWSKKDPQQVSRVWSKLKTSYNFNNSEQQTIQRALALGLARDNDPNAAAWLDTIKPQFADAKVREWQIRLALAKLNWCEVNMFITQLPAEEKNKSIWRYWNARALEELGQKATAQKIYVDLSKKVDYYGLLASQRLNINYQPNDTYNSFNFNFAENNAAIQRARELYLLNRMPEARREWQWGIEKMSPSELKSATQLAYQLNWYDRAIITAAKAADWNNLTVRFPLVYGSDIATAAAKNNINPVWVYAIMRQESTFMTDARSSVGALGLMQLMPNTAKILAKVNVSEDALLSKATNISLGTKYLKQLSDGYQGNLVFASAAYNLGPTRLKKWLPLYNTLPRDVWIELLPWGETRDYVKAILLNMAIYQQKLNQPDSKK